MFADVLAKVGWFYMSGLWSSRSPEHTGILTQSSTDPVGQEAERKKKAKENAYFFKTVLTPRPHLKRFTAS